MLDRPRRGVGAQSPVISDFPPGTLFFAEPGFFMRLSGFNQNTQKAYFADIQADGEYLGVTQQSLSGRFFSVPYLLNPGLAVSRTVSELLEHPPVCGWTRQPRRRPVPRPPSVAHAAPLSSGFQSLSCMLGPLSSCHDPAQALDVILDTHPGPAAPPSQVLRCLVGG